MQGKVIKYVLKGSDIQPGNYNLLVELFTDGKKFSPGVYFIKFIFENEVVTKRVVVAE